MLNMGEKMKIIKIKFFVLMSMLVLLLGCLSSEDVNDILGACSGMDFDEVKTQNDISEECRDAIESSLPSPQNNYSSVLLALGNEVDATTNKPKLYILGADSSGNALTQSDFENAVVKVTEGGATTTLISSDFDVTSLDGATGDLASIVVATDYSGSMRDDDLDDLELLYGDVFFVLPLIYEAESIVFSGTVTVRQDFTEDKTIILSALEKDSSITRNSTALYDGMGTGIDNLSARTRPIKILITATDGLENASASWTKEEVISGLSDNNIFVVMVGALFSDVTALQELSESNGLYFYARSFFDAENDLLNFIDSLEDIYSINIDDAYQNADSVTVTINGVSTTFDF